jgi:hypothetical protein
MKVGMDSFAAAYSANGSGVNRSAPEARRELQGRLHRILSTVAKAVCLPWRGDISAAERVQQVADSAVAFACVAQACVFADRVVVAAAFAGTSHDSRVFQIGDNALHGAFSDPNLFRRFAQAQVRVFRQANQNTGMISQKSPGRSSHVFIVAQTGNHWLFSARSGYGQCGRSVLQWFPGDMP